MEREAARRPGVPPGDGGQRGGETGRAHRSPKMGRRAERGRAASRLSLGEQGWSEPRPGLVDCWFPPGPQEPQPQGFDNQAFLNNPDEANWAPAPSPSSSPAPPAPPEPKPPSPETLRRVPESPAVALDGDGPAAVRSILTKERRPEGGYKAVWFGEDIGAEADVVVLNTPASEVDGAGSEGSGDEGAEVGLRGGAQRAPGSDSIYL